MRKALPLLFVFGLAACNLTSTTPDDSPTPTPPTQPSEPTTPTDPPSPPTEEPAPQPEPEPTPTPDPEPEPEPEPENRAPTVTVEGATTGTAPFDLELIANGKDPDGDTLSYIWTTPLEQTQGPRYSTTLDEGSYELNVVVSDGELIASANVTVTVSEDQSEPAPASLTVNIEPCTGPALISQNEEYIAVAPCGEAITLGAGTYIVSVSDEQDTGEGESDGFDPQFIEVTLQAGEVRVLDVTLE